MSLFELTSILWGYHRRRRQGSPAAIIHGASQRLRPILMTAISTMVGLLPIMFSDGTGSMVMQRIAAPMVGGMLSTLVLILLVLPVVFLLYKQWSLAKK